MKKWIYKGIDFTSYMTLDEATNKYLYAKTLPEDSNFRHDAYFCIYTFGYQYPYVLRKGNTIKRFTFGEWLDYYDITVY